MVLSQAVVTETRNLISIVGRREQVELRNKLLYGVLVLGESLSSVGSGSDRSHSFGSMSYCAS